MSNDRKRLSFLRVLGSLILAAVISVSLLLAVDVGLKQFFRQTAMRMPYYILTGISMVVLFFLLVFPANRPLRGVKVFLRWVAVIAAVLVVWGAGTVWNLQGDMIYITDQYEPASEAKIKALPNAEEITVAGRNGQQYKGWFWKNTQGPAGLVIFFGGNAQYAAESTYYTMTDTTKAAVYAGYNYLMMDYPGYGLSQGEPGEESIYDMARATWDHMTARQDVLANKIVLAGWSLGTGTVSRLAAEKDPAGLILMAPFYDGAALINDFVDAQVMQGPTRALVRYPYHSNKYARKTTTKALIIAATDDRMIPKAQAEKLAAEYPQHELVIVQGGHSAPYNRAEAAQAIAAYLKQVLSQP